MRAAALFASWLQPSEALTTGRVEEAVVWAVRQLGVGGCAGRMAQEFGDHPEAAAERMRWVAGSRPRPARSKRPAGSSARSWSWRAVAESGGRVGPRPADIGKPTACFQPSPRMAS